MFVDTTIKTGPMIKQETYKDENLTMSNGRFCWYDEKGKIDSCGLVKNSKKDGRWDYFFGDSTNPTYYIEYNNGKFVKQSSYNIKDTANKDDDVNKQEATFRNGNKGWIRYLENNLITPDRLKTLGRGSYLVTVCFLVDKEGKVEDLYLRKSVEWSADAEIFSIIEKAPLWNPALENGKPVYYRQAENITYVVN
jgi:protein TonB